jgi:hypothetical protein
MYSSYRLNVNLLFAVMPGMPPFAIFFIFAFIPRKYRLKRTGSRDRIKLRSHAGVDLSFLRVAAGFIFFRCLCLERKNIFLPVNANPTPPYRIILLHRLDMELDYYWAPVYALIV